MDHKINIKKLAKIQKIALQVSTATGHSVNDILAKNNGDRHVFLRVLLTKVAMENGVNPYQVSLFLCKHHSTALHYEKMYLILKHNLKFKELEKKYYEKYGDETGKTTQ